MHSVDSARVAQGFNDLATIHTSEIKLSVLGLHTKVDCSIKNTDRTVQALCSIALSFCKNPGQDPSSIKERITRLPGVQQAITNLRASFQALPPRDQEAILTNSSQSATLINSIGQETESFAVAAALDFIFTSALTMVQ